MKLFIKQSIGCIAFIVAISIISLSCRKSNLPPIAKLQAFPSIGDTSILFQFSARESEDDRDYPIGLVYRWDKDGDGNWDSDYARNFAFTHRYKLPGAYNISVEVKDLDELSSIAKDTIIVFGENLDIDTLVDTRDGNRYRIVKIQNRWWMAENLRYGIEIPTSRDQTDNDTIEFYRELVNNERDTVGGVYSWLESLNYQVKEPKGICPDRWHLPTKPEWEALIIPYPDLYSVQYYGKNGLSKLNLDLNNGGIKVDGSFFWALAWTWDNGFWSSSSRLGEKEYLPYHIGFSSHNKEIDHGFWGSTGLDRYYSVRCIKDN